MRRIAASFALGALLPLAFAPFGLWWLAPVLIAAYAWVFLSQVAKRVFLTGFAFGAGAFLTGTYWLYHSVYIIGKTPIILALLLMLGLVAIMALYYGLHALLVMRFARGSRPAAIALIPGVWVLLEWLRGWLMSGFPWLSLGYALPETPLGGWLPIGGVYLGSFILVVASALLLLLFEPALRRKVIGGAGLAIVIIASIVTYGRQYVQPDSDRLSVTIGQLGLDQSLKWDARQFESTLRWYGDFVAAERGVDMLLMPEVAIPTVDDQVDGYLSQLGQLGAQRGSAVVLGILRRHDDGRPANALLAMQGAQRDWYDKRHLVPFGEYFPVPAFVREWMRLRGLPYSDIRPGEAVQPPLIVAGVQMATSICYEDAYGAEQQLFFPGARMIINVSNDAWFGDSIAPHQHLQIARTRSAESQRWQVRATNTGISAFIDGRGRVVSRAPSFEPATLSGALTLVSGHTPFTRLGNWPVLLIALLIVLIVAALAYRATRSEQR